MKKLIALMLTLCLACLSFAACRQAQPEDAAEETEQTADIFRFEDYESDEVFNIKQVELSEALAEKCTSYKFTYLSDGLRIKAYISIPQSMIASQQPGKCLLYNRGGNRDFATLEKETTATICAACDRIVVASQYRGGGGSQGKDEFGGADLHDVIQLIDLCEQQFTFIDMDDFCVAGASRGGVMTYPAARQDSRIKRIIAISAVSDLIDAYDRRDDMKEVLLETIGKTPEEDPAGYQARSAIYWADEIKVPVLMFHSRQDAQVDFSQAEALYEKLKDHVDCTFITYDDDVHGLHQEDFAIIRKWLNGEEVQGNG